MISDILSEAVDEIDEYLNNPLYNNVYDGLTRLKIEQVRTDMNELRKELDMCK